MIKFMSDLFKSQPNPKINLASEKRVVVEHPSVYHKWKAMGLLTFLYNSLLIIFIFLHLLVGGAITFGAGIYAGIYISQNYEIPRVDDPGKLWEKFKEFADQHKKEK